MDLGAFSQYVDLGIVLGAAIIVKVLVELIKRATLNLTGVATVRLVIGLSLMCSTAAVLVGNTGEPWGALVLKALLAAAGAIGIDVMGNAASGKEV